MKKNSEELFLDKIEIGVRSKIREAIHQFSEMNVRAALQILSPLVEINEPAALYYSSCWSLAEEAESQFTSRLMRQLAKAAELGYPPALHKLAVCYDSGDFVEMDTIRAAQLFQEAAHKGHPHSQWIHGLNLLYGMNGVRKDENEGIEFIKSAFDSKFEGAIVSVAEFYKEGKFGFPVNTEESKALMALSETSNILGY